MSSGEPTVPIDGPAGPVASGTMVGSPPRARGRTTRRLATGATGAGALTMVALSFANSLQGGGSQTFAQATEQLKHSFHINDAALGVIPFLVGIVGNAGAVPIAWFCARHRRTAVLSAMFVGWGLLFAGSSLVTRFGILGFAGAGFVLLAFLRVASSFLEATDPASLPLIADWWPVETRSVRISIFNAAAGVGAFGGLIISGFIVQYFGWRWAFAMWLPLALVGAVLIRTRHEPERGVQDAAYSERLENATSGAEHDLVVELVEEEPEVVASTIEGEVASKDRWASARAVARLRSWRLAAVGIAVTQIASSGLGFWGLAYFKRTFHLSAVKASALTPELGIGAFVGVLGGGYLADRLMRRGMVRARVYVTAAGFGGAGLFAIAAFSTTRLLVAAPLLSLSQTLWALPTGPQFALLLDVAPAPLRSQAAAAANVLQAGGAIGALLVGAVSTLLGSNLRLALLCMTPFYLVGSALVLAARRTYIEDVALVVAEAKGHTG